MIGFVDRDVVAKITDTKWVLITERVGKPILVVVRESINGVI